VSPLTAHLDALQNKKSEAEVQTLLQIIRVLRCRKSEYSHRVYLYSWFFYYWYSTLRPVWAEIRAQSGDWYGSGKLHPGQVLRGSSLPLLSPAFLDVPTFATRCPHVRHDARDPSDVRWNCGRECCHAILPKWRLLRHLVIFYMPQIYDMGPTALLPLRRKEGVLRIFFP